MQQRPTQGAAAAAASAPGSNMLLISRCCTTGLGGFKQTFVTHCLRHSDSAGHSSSLAPAAARSLTVAAAAAGGTTTRSSRSRTSGSVRHVKGSNNSSSSSSSSHSGGDDSEGLTASTRMSLSAQAAAGVGNSRGKTLMVVESPTKAAKIQKFLGDDYKVVASYGHVRDLANKPGSVKPDEDWGLVWQLTGSGANKMQELAAASAGCRALLLATDPDREGEAISWHITEELKRRGVLPRPGLTLQRVTFNEVTQKAVTEALQQPRQVSVPLVDAYLARRALDYMVGFNLSPLLWRRLGRTARSAGRVQSVALRLVCDREDERQVFNPEEYWSIAADFTAAAAPGSSSSSAAGSGDVSNAAGVSLTARLVQVDGRRLQTMSIGSQQAADLLVARLWQQQQDASNTAAGSSSIHSEYATAEGVLYRVASVVRKPVKRSPPPPLVTSSLQQEAGRRLGWGASKTMSVAQQLYEGANTGEGLITYMRTDGVNLSAEAVDTLRGLIGSQYGASYLPPAGSRVYKTRAKNAQEAHEAIRPTNPALLPGDVEGLTPDQAKLYALVWARAVASQMESAELTQVTVELQSPCSTLLLRSTGSSLAFPGYLAAWKGIGSSSSSADSAAAAGSAAAGDLSEVEDDDVAALAGPKGSALSRVLQQLQEGQLVALTKVSPVQHFTKPPPRFTEASMVKALEEAGVGRPSTYAPTIRLLQDRGYVLKSGRSLAPTPLGRLMVSYLTLFFPRYVDVNFTAKVEEQLDEVSAGGLAWRQVLGGFHGPLQQDIAAAQKCSTTQVFEQLEEKLEHLIFPQQQQQQQHPAADTAEAAAAAEAAGGTATGVLNPRVCPVCGGRLVLKPSSLIGGFIGCSNHDSLGCTFSRPLWPDAEEAALISDEEEEVAKAAAAGGSSSSVIGSAKLLGQHPDSGKPVWIKRGPFGLYLQLGDDAPNPAAAAAAAEGAISTETSNSSSSKAKSKAKSSSSAAGPSRAPLPRGVSWSEITLEAALQQLALPRTVGVHPETGEPILANSGRFGPYLKHKTLTVTVPKGCGPLDVTLEQALAAVAAKETRMRARGRDPYEVKPSKKTGAKQAASSSKTKGSQAGCGSGSGSGSSSSRTRGISGYNLFAREMNGQGATAPAASSSSSSKGASMLSQIAAAWKALSEDEKAAFSDRAKLVNAEASAAAEDGAANGSSSRSRTSSSSSRSSSSRIAGSRTSLASSAANGNGSGNGRAYSTSSSSSSSSRRRTSIVKPLSGYQFYCKQQRAAVVADHPALKPSEVLSLLAAAWRRLDEQQQQDWSQQAAAAAAGGGGAGSEDRSHVLV